MGAIIKMSLLPYTSPYYRGAYPQAYGAYPYGPYGMTAEEIKKVREAEEKAFMEAESKRKEFMEAEKAKYEEFVAAEKKKYEDYVAAQKKAVEDAIAKEKELSEKLGPYAYGPYGGFGPGYAGAAGFPGAYGPGYGAGYGAGYGYGYPGAYRGAGFPYY